MAKRSYSDRSSVCLSSCRTASIIAHEDALRFRDTLSALVMMSLRFLVPLFLLSLAQVFAQGNYEVQVYPGQVQNPGTTMIELHSNFTIQGSKGTTDGVLGTEHQLHETVEITHGFTPWFETGFYIFTSAQPNEGWQWVDDHIRPRIAAPEEW